VLDILLSWIERFIIVRSSFCCCCCCISSIIIGCSSSLILFLCKASSAYSSLKYKVLFSFEIMLILTSGYNYSHHHIDVYILAIINKIKLLIFYQTIVILLLIVALYDVDSEPDNSLRFNKKAVSWNLSISRQHNNNHNHRFGHQTSHIYFHQVAA
jgi:hypothetical protein